MARKMPAASKTPAKPESVAHRKPRIAAGGAGGFRHAKLPGDERLADAMRASVRSLNVFVKSARLVAASEEKLRKKFPGLWVAIHDGKVVAHAPDTKALGAELARLHIRREDSLIRKFERKPRALAV